MNIEGLWVVTFARCEPKEIKSGTAVFQDGLILGGDNEQCYIGDYEQIGDQIKGIIDLPGHTIIDSPSPFFGKHKEPVINFVLRKEAEGPFQFIGDGEIKNPVDVQAHFTFALQLAYRLG